MKYLVLMFLVGFTFAADASRLKESVSFNLSLPKFEQYVPFTVIVPQSFRGQFVRFVHPFNGKSAVAKVVKREGEAYKTNPDLAEAIGVKTSIARVFIEEVY
tara:strand:- start:1144 stop:1449 length:306 start_codon:yes stop_codon:yes gene_type:complete